MRLGLVRDPAHLADPATMVFDSDGNLLGAFAALLEPRWRAPQASTDAYSKDWPPARGSADEAVLAAHLFTAIGLHDEKTVQLDVDRTRHFALHVTVAVMRRDLLHKRERGEVEEQRRATFR